MQIMSEFVDFAKSTELRRGEVCASYWINDLSTTPVDGSCERMQDDNRCFVDDGGHKRSFTMV